MLSTKFIGNQLKSEPILLRLQEMGRLVEVTWRETQN